MVVSWMNIGPLDLHISPERLDTEFEIHDDNYGMRRLL